jgi:hypothetical protein
LKKNKNKRTKKKTMKKREPRCGLSPGCPNTVGLKKYLGPYA